jgi:hypothetical protein
MCRRNQNRTINTTLNINENFVSSSSENKFKGGTFLEADYIHLFNAMAGQWIPHLMFLNSRLS